MSAAVVIRTCNELQSTVSVFDLMCYTASHDGVAVPSNDLNLLASMPSACC